MSHNFLVIDPEKDGAALKGISSAPRVSILRLLLREGGMNVNDIAKRLGLPQSSVSSNVQVLEEAGLLRTEAQRARKGSQKICHAIYDELIITFRESEAVINPHQIEVAMPLGLYTNSDVTGPCGICSPDGVIGLLDVPETFLDPERMKASLLWFTSGFVEYQFPNNAKLIGAEIEQIEFAMEISSVVPGTLADWPSDIVMSINGVELGAWTSPGDFGDKRGAYTPAWWTMSGSQYGMLKSWTVNGTGAYIDGRKLSAVTVDRLDLNAHRSIRLKIEVKPDASHPGGVNVFGRRFGNYDQDIVMRLHTRR